MSTSAACNCDPDTYEPHAPWCAKGSDLPATSIPYEGTDCTPEEAVAAVKAVRTSAARTP